MSTTTPSERTRFGYGLREEEGEDFWLFGALVTIKIGANDTAGQYSVMDIETPPGVGSPWHAHRDEDEWFYVHEGECEVYIGDAHMTLTAGGFAFGPKGVPHTFFGGPNGGKMLVWAGGTKFEGLLREIAEPAPQHVLPPPPEGPPDMDLLLPIADKWAYDILALRVHHPGAKSVTTRPTPDSTVLGAAKRACSAANTRRPFASEQTERARFQALSRWAVPGSNQ